MAHPHEFNDEEIDPAGAPRQERDPVCGMTVDPASALRLAEQGRDHYFCSPHCLNRFSADPGRYLSGPKKADRETAAKRSGGEADPRRPIETAPSDAIYTCPKHPENRHTGPRTCPICRLA